MVQPTPINVRRRAQGISGQRRWWPGRLLRQKPPVLGRTPHLEDLPPGDPRQHLPTGQNSGRALPPQQWWAVTPMGPDRLLRDVWWCKLPACQSCRFWCGLRGWGRLSEQHRVVLSQVKASCVCSVMADTTGKVGVQSCEKHLAVYRLVHSQSLPELPA